MNRTSTHRLQKLAGILLALIAGLGCALGVVTSATAMGLAGAAADVEPAYAATQGWKKSGARWWYQYADGTYAKGWKAVGGDWYSFDSSGWMRTGWYRQGSTWYYLENSGRMAVGWRRLGGVWYHFADSGAMAKGWRRVGGSWYRFNASGAMVTGWQKVGRQWYFMEPSGAMRANAWVGNTYYVQSDGSMATDKWVDGGRYYVDSQGRWVKGKVKAAVPLFSEAGALHVSGTHLVGANGKQVQLRGVSTHGLAWYPQYVSREAFKTLRDDWGANVVRLAMYTEEYGGYCSGGNRAELEALVDKGVKAAYDLGMYVIVDWHILNDNNPQTHQSDAVSFFKRMAAKYKSYGNVIYEICNEPHWVSYEWNIKPYAEEVLKAIRSSAPNAVVLVGTNTWSQDVDDVIGKRLADKNVMYTLHFYAGTHKEWNREKLTKALAAGVPVFVSECSITDASGNGSLDVASAKEWMRLLNDNGVSFVAWSLSNKDESSALLKPSTQALSGWSAGQLSEAGKWWRSTIKAS